jgi:hypothetical protein
MRNMLTAKFRIMVETLMLQVKAPLATIYFANFSGHLVRV